jgi:outer membrane protein
MKRFSYFLVILSTCCRLFAQDVLTVSDAIKISLQKNYAILIVKNNQEIAKAQNNGGNAGMSPTISLNGGLLSANLNSFQEFNTGAVQDIKGATSNNLSTSLNANWNVFDGLKMFAIKKYLALNEDLSAIELKQQMENTVYDVIISYYDIVKTAELIKAAKQNLRIYEERKKIAKLKLEIGSDSKVDFLLSQSNENKAKSEIIQLELKLLVSKTALNNLMNQPVDYDFKTTDSIVTNYNPSLDELKKSTESGNSALLISKQNQLISVQSIREARAANLPVIQLNGAYNFTRNQSQAGIVFLNRQSGLNAGITASWLIFNGNKNNRLVKERHILALNQNYLTEQTKSKVDALVYLNYKTYALNRQLLELEYQNVKDSKEVLEVSLERYKIGKANLLETIETQKNLEDAQIRFINAQYAMKVSETELLRANGSLIK